MNTLKIVNRRFLLLVLAAIVAGLLVAYPLFATSFSDPITFDPQPLAGPAIGGGGSGGGGGCC